MNDKSKNTTTFNAFESLSDEQKKLLLKFCANLKNPDFYKKFKESPIAALSICGINLKTEKEIVVLSSDTDIPKDNDSIYLQLPSSTKVEELSEEELKQCTGGIGNLWEISKGLAYVIARGYLKINPGKNTSKKDYDENSRLLDKGIKNLTKEIKK